MVARLWVTEGKPQVLPVAGSWDYMAASLSCGSLPICPLPSPQMEEMTPTWT